MSSESDSDIWDLFLAFCVCVCAARVFNYQIVCCLVTFFVKHSLWYLLLRHDWLFRSKSKLLHRGQSFAFCIAHKSNGQRCAGEWQCWEGADSIVRSRDGGGSEGSE